MGGDVHKFCSITTIFICVFVFASAEHVNKVQMDLNGIDTTKPLGGKNPEDSIPVIEIKGEGKPMTAAQIRALEEATGGPPDIKVDLFLLSKSGLKSFEVDIYPNDCRSNTLGYQPTVRAKRNGRTS
jgi:hypothetical protein